MAIFIAAAPLPLLSATWIAQDTEMSHSYCKAFDQNAFWSICFDMQSARSLGQMHMTKIGLSCDVTHMIFTFILQLIILVIFCLFFGYSFFLLFFLFLLFSLYPHPIFLGYSNRKQQWQPNECWLYTEYVMHIKVLKLLQVFCAAFCEMEIRRIFRSYINLGIQVIIHTYNCVPLNIFTTLKLCMKGVCVCLEGGGWGVGWTEGGSKKWLSLTYWLCFVKFKFKKRKWSENQGQKNKKS